MLHRRGYGAKNETAGSSTRRHPADRTNKGHFCAITLQAHPLGAPRRKDWGSAARPSWGDTRHRTGEGRTASLSEASSGPHRQCSSDITLRPKSAVPATKSSKTPMTPLRPSIDAGSSSYLATVVWLPSSWRLCLSSRYPPVHSLDLACHRPNGHVHRQSFGHPPQSPVLAPAALYP